jgi:hypothetical protein
MAITLDGTAGINASGSLTTSSSLTTGTGAIYNGLQRSTAVASTSGTSIDFTSIPSWAKRITVMYQAVSTNGSSAKLVQIGAGSVTTTGYTSQAIYSGSASASPVTTTATNGFVIGNTAAADSLTGMFILLNVTGNDWTGTHTISVSGSSVGMQLGSGFITLSGALDRVRITTANGTDTYDAGTINIIYE